MGDDHVISPSARNPPGEQHRVEGGGLMRGVVPTVVIDTAAHVRVICRHRILQNQI
jgi:hypothetical protein